MTRKAMLTVMGAMALLATSLCPSKEKGSLPGALRRAQSNWSARGMAEAAQALGVVRENPKDGLKYVWIPHYAHSPARDPAGWPAARCAVCGVGRISGITASRGCQTGTPSIRRSPTPISACAACGGRTNLDPYCLYSSLREKDFTRTRTSCNRQEATSERTVW